jgi:hypothetical protein
MDDQAAQVAEQMFAKGGAAGDMPTSRKAANGGTGSAGGSEIEDTARKGGTAKGGYGMLGPAMGIKPPAPKKPPVSKANGDEEEDEDEADVEKSGKTGDQVTNEPGRQGRKSKTGSAITSEPDEQDASDSTGQGAGLETDADEDPQHRQRKSGKVGVPDQEADGDEPGSGSGGNLDQSDDTSRKRQAGQVGISKGAAAIDADALIKSLETLEAIAEGSTVAAPADRRADLAGKLADGTLSKSEMQELHTLTKADVDEMADLQKSGDDESSQESFQEQFASDDELKKGYEVSDFLERHSQVTAAALDQVQTTLAKSIESHRDRATAFNVQLAKSLTGMARLVQSQEALIKGLSSRLETVESTPLPRKGASTTRALSKSLDGEVGAGASDQLTRTQLMDGLENMLVTGRESTPSGHRIDHAIALLENGGSIAKSLYQDVANHLQKSGRVAVS